MKVAVVADRIETVSPNTYYISSECWENKFYPYTSPNLHNNCGSGHSFHHFTDSFSKRISEVRQVAQIQIPRKWQSWYSGPGLLYSKVQDLLHFHMGPLYLVMNGM